MQAAPRIVVTSGEPAGIGPEICLRLADADLAARPVVIADYAMLQARAAAIGWSGKLTRYLPDQPAAHEGSSGELAVLDLPLAAPATPGRLDPANAPAVLAMLDRAIDGCRRGEFAAMVTAPVQKSVLSQAGQPFSGHTEYLAARTGTSRVVMMLAGECTCGTGDTGNAPRPLRVALATTHLPLRAVADAITPQLLEETIAIIDADLRRKYAIARPRILICGLNPHAGEDGHLGSEEKDVIAPTVERLRQQGMRLLGPLPADTAFTPPQLASCDCVLAMYHDQGLTALKYATFGAGVNVTLGLPIIRTSVDHGTALALAGSGSADPGSLFAAFGEAARMAEAAKKAGQAAEHAAGSAAGGSA